MCCTWYGRSPARLVKGIGRLIGPATNLPLRMIAGFLWCDKAERAFLLSPSSSSLSRFSPGTLANCSFPIILDPRATIILGKFLDLTALFTDLPPPPWELQRSCKAKDMVWRWAVMQSQEKPWDLICGCAEFPNINHFIDQAWFSVALWR